MDNELKILWTYCRTVFGYWWVITIEIVLVLLDQVERALGTSYASTIAFMAIFTVVLEFGGGTYVSQFKAASAHAAAVIHAAHSISIKGMSTPSDRKRLPTVCR